MKIWKNTNRYFVSYYTDYKWPRLEFSPDSTQTKITGSGIQLIDRIKVQDLIGLTKTQNEYNNKIMLVKIYNVHSRTGPSLRSGSRRHNPAQLDHHHHHQSLSVKNNFVYETFRTNKCKIYAPRSLEHAFRKSYMPLHLLRN